MIKYLNIFYFIPILLISQNDTITINSHQNTQLTWYGDYDNYVQFPNQNNFEKILMDFNLGCADGGCSHWDYTVNVYLMKSNGLLDSSIISIDTISYNPFLFDSLWQYQFQSNIDPNLITDSILIIDTLQNELLVLDTTWNYYDQFEKYEIGRLITPYGNYMDWDLSSDVNDLYDDDWTHKYEFDITDFAPLLSDSSIIRVHYDGWTSGFSASIDFHFINGIPPRNIISVENIYPPGSYSYESLSDNINFPPYQKFFSSDIKGSAIINYVSGHGHEGPQSCCEWIPKIHNININGFEVNTWTAWNDCGFIPVYPQGGTWPFDRAGWCPGEAVTKNYIDISDNLIYDDFNIIDYGIQEYLNNGESNGTYILSNILVTYDEFNFGVDLELYDIIKPSLKDEWSRLNPTCLNPLIKIRNRGGQIITNAKIRYGIIGNELDLYTWNGIISPLEIISIELPTPNWNNITNNSKFIATVVLDDDEYQINNSLTSDLEIPEIFPQNFMFEYRSQNDFQGIDRANQNSYLIFDDQGNIVFERNSGNFEPGTWYRDTVNLPIGCFNLVFYDSAEDGINEHWYSGESASGAGRVQLREIGGSLFKRFPDDFGEKISIYFTTEFPLSNSEIKTNNFKIYPIPSKDILKLSLMSNSHDDINVTIINSFGKEIKVFNFKDKKESIEIDIRDLSSGVYFCQFSTKNIDEIKKFIIVE